MDEEKQQETIKNENDELLFYKETIEYFREIIEILNKGQQQVLEKRESVNQTITKMPPLIRKIYKLEYDNVLPSGNLSNTHKEEIGK